jgi:hypothetical protein
MKKIFLVLVASTCITQLWSQGTLRVSAGSHIKISGGAYLVMDNMHIVNDGTFLQGVGDGIVKLTGGTNIDLSGNSSIMVDKVELKKSPGSIVNLNSNLAVVTSLEFGGGLLNLNNSALKLGNTGLLLTESETSRAYTNGDGYIESTGILNSPSAKNLGNLGAVITSATNLGNTTIRRGHKIQPSIYGSNNSIQRYYDIIPANNMALKATLRVNYFDAELNGITESTLNQWKSKNGVTWDFMGADLRDVAANFVEKKTYGSFDRITLATATAPVIACPANITANANLKGCKASVSFSATASGIPAPTIVYRIGNSVITSPQIFSKGTTTVTATASNGVLPDATCTFTVTVVCGGQSNFTSIPVEKTPEQTVDKLTISASPNPSSDYFALDIKSRERGFVTIRVADAVGRVLSAWSNVSSNSTWHLGQHYRPGVYYVQVRQGKEIQTLKLVKQAY